MTGEPGAAAERGVRSSYAQLPELLTRDGELCPAGGVLVLELTGPGVVDVTVVGALARLRLEARRVGADLRVRAPDADLCRLAELVGLCDVLDLPPPASAAGSAQAQR